MRPASTFLIMQLSNSRIRVQFRMEFVTFCKSRENYAQGSQIYVKFMKETGLSEKIHLFAERCIFLCYTPIFDS